MPVFPPKIPPRSRPLIGRARIIAQEWYTYLESLTKTIIDSSTTGFVALLAVEAAARAAADSALSSLTTTLLAKYNGTRAAGKALNADPNMTNIALWTMSGGGSYSIQTITDGVTGNTVLRGDANFVSGGITDIGTPIPISGNKAYRVSGWARKFAGTDGVVYLGAAYLDNANAGISPIFAANGVAGSTAFTFYSITFGPGTANAFPAGTKSLCVTLSGNYGGTVGYFEFQGVVIEEITDVLAGNASDAVIVASVVAEAAARVSADGALATDITTLFASYNDISASGVISAAVAATAAGADASYEIFLSAGSYTAVFRMDAMSGGGSRIEFSASQISFNGTLLVNGAVATGFIAASAVTKGIDQSGAGPVTIPGDGTPGTLASGSFTTSGSDVLIDISGIAALQSAGSATIQWYVYHGATLKHANEMGNLIYLTPQNLVGSHDQFGELNITTFFAPAVATTDTWYLIVNSSDGIAVDFTNFRILVKDWVR